MGDVDYSVKKRQPQLTKPNTVHFEDPNQSKTNPRNPINPNAITNEKPRKSSVQILRNRFFR
ncbi:unnamed protein product, partial [Schistosoma turkestanicum]